MGFVSLPAARAAMLSLQQCGSLLEMTSLRGVPGEALPFLYKFTVKLHAEMEVINPYLLYPIVGGYRQDHCRSQEANDMLETSTYMTENILRKYIYELM